MRDSQRQKVYDWQRCVKVRLGSTLLPQSSDYQTPGEIESREVYPSAPVTLRGSVEKRLSKAEVKELVYKLRWQGNLKKSPKIDFVRRGCCWYCAMGHLIRMPEWGMTAWTVTHEMCHAIEHALSWRRGLSTPSHGRLFVGLLMHFMERNFNVPNSVMVAEAHRLGVDFQNITNKDLK